MKELNMDYNSQRDELVIPEYGRNVQKLIRHAKTIEDPAKRQEFVEKVVDLMLQMHPQSRNMDDYRDKLWKHVFIIAEFELDVNPPSGRKPTREEVSKKPERVEYPVIEARFRHYGHNVQVLIKKALSMPQGPKREAFVGVIGNYMKLAYKTWNKEHYVSDEIIKGDLQTLSGGQLELHEDASLDNLTNANRRRKHTNGGSGGSGGGGGHYHKPRINKGRRKK